ncbi:hypothetical protein O181_080069 [Austropuccinia psidii MF-1]|uniref:Uncharacterized protein n=1 Tax=Austropuccinia psidii MF-1 TaxID=1389203 RepID=A0A9Q3IIU2_9BASI|nr:hypothetical protein [Austropuccinia psidii MF-1]
MDANTTDTSDMGPQKPLYSPESSDMECSSSESIIFISTAIPNPPPELPEEAPHAHWASSMEISTEVLFGAEIEVITKEQFLNNSSQIAPRLEGMSKDAHIPQYVQGKLQEAREPLVSDIDCLDLFSPISESLSIYETIWNISLFQSSMSILAGLPKRLHALYLLVHNLVQPSQHQNQQVANILFEAIALYMDDQNPLVTFNISDSASSDSLSGSQEGTSITSKGILTPTLTGLADNILQLMIAFNLVRAHTKVDWKTTQKIGKKLVKRGVDPLQALVNIQDQMKAGRPCYNLIAAFLTGGVCGLLVCSADYRISSVKGTLQLLEVTSILKRKQSFPDEDIRKRTNKYICEILHESFFSNHSSLPICPSKYCLAEYLALNFSEAWKKTPFGV